MEKKKLLFIGLGAFLVIAVGVGLFFLLREKPRKVVGTDTLKHVAYIKINPSVKLNYSYVCTKYSDDTEECEDPKVDEYELVNDDAKEIFKEVNLLEGDKELSHVIDVICKKVEEKGIKVENVEIQSDWNNIEKYLEKKQEEKQKTTEETKTNTNTETETTNNENETTTNTNETEVKETEVPKQTYTFNNQTKETIDNTIKEDVEKETKEKEEKAKKEAEEVAAKAKAEAEAKAKAEAAAKAKAAVTIKLSSGVKYCHSMQTFECNKCFSTALINSLKSAKGHYVKSANASSITIMRITSLTSPYNSTNYFGTGQISKITKAGGQEAGGAGGCDDTLTAAVCKQFHLTCQ